MILTTFRFRFNSSRAVIGIAISLATASGAKAADQATLICRQGGVGFYDTTPAASIRCNGAMSDECKRSFEQALMSQYGRNDWYSAAKLVCEKLPLKNGGTWYPHEIRTR